MGLCFFILQIIFGAVKIAAAGPRELQFCLCSWLTVWELPFSGYDWKIEESLNPTVGKEPVCFSLMNCINCV